MGAITQIVKLPSASPSPLQESSPKYSIHGSGPPRLCSTISGETQRAPVPPLRAWTEDGAAPRWAIDSVCDGYNNGERIPKEPAKGKPAPHGLSQPEPVASVGPKELPTRRRMSYKIPSGPRS